MSFSPELQQRQREQIFFTHLQEFRDLVEERRLYPWLWHALYQTNLLSNVNWGNIIGNRNWLMQSSGIPWLVRCPLLQIL